MLETFPHQGNTHVELGQEHPPYNSDPPTLGWHTDLIAAWGSYDTVVPDELLVHNMEDGGIILWYSYGSGEENRRHIAALEKASSGFRRVVIAPREDMPTTYALTASGHLLRRDEFDKVAIRDFLERFVDIDHHPR